MGLSLYVPVMPVQPVTECTYGVVIGFTENETKLRLFKTKAYFAKSSAMKITSQDGLSDARHCSLTSGTKRRD